MEEYYSILILSIHFYCEQLWNTVHMIHQHLLTLKSSFLFNFFTNLMSGVIWQLNINVIISLRISINVCKVSFIKKTDIVFSENQWRLAVSMCYLDANGISSSDKNILWWAISVVVESPPPAQILITVYLALTL